MRYGFVNEGEVELFIKFYWLKSKYTGKRLVTRKKKWKKKKNGDRKQNCERKGGTKIYVTELN